MSDIQAVFFDVGGVVIKSPLIAISTYEGQLGLPKNYLNIQIVRAGSDGAWQRFERGEMELTAFYEAFGRELSNTVDGNPYYIDYCQKRGLNWSALPNADLKVDGRQLFGCMMRGATYDPLVVEAIHQIRETRRWKVVALTNNFSTAYDAILALPETETFSPEAELEFLGWGQNGGPGNPTLRAMFDDFIDSSAVGRRKPEPEFYLYACDKHGLQPNEVVFLDDLGMNLKAAADLGMKTIHVPIGQSAVALRQLENILGIDLLEATRPSAASSKL